MEPALNRPGMRFGPYLLFLRSKMAISDYHDFRDWRPLADADYRQMWGEDAAVTMFSRPGELAALQHEMPDWIDFLELVSISTDYASIVSVDDGPRPWGSFDPEEDEPG
jgi:hypothetical protein